MGELPGWLVIVVVSRDVLIIGAVVLSWLLGKPVEMRPLFLSKANTAGADRLRGGRAGLARLRHRASASGLA